MNIADNVTSGARSVESSTDVNYADAAPDRSIIAEALRRLSPAYRQILLETVIRRHTLQMTATRLGIREATVRSRLYLEGAIHVINHASMPHGAQAAQHPAGQSGGGSLGQATTGRPPAGWHFRPPRSGAAQGPKLVRPERSRRPIPSHRSPTFTGDKPAAGDARTPRALPQRASVPKTPR